MSRPFLTARWLKERYWGFGHGRGGEAILYRVEHPVWRTYAVRCAGVGIDPGVVMGGAWAEIDWAPRLHSVVLAEGSEAAIHDAGRLLGQAA